MNQTSSREYNAMLSQNSSRIQSITHSLILPSSRAKLQIPKNEFILQYPCQPKDPCSLELIGLENDYNKDPQIIDSLSHRSSSERIKNIIILAEKKKITSPSIKKRGQAKSRLVNRFISKIKISNNSFATNEYVQTLLQENTTECSEDVNQVLLKSSKQAPRKYELKKSINFPLSRYGIFRSIWKIIMKVVYLTILIFSPFVLIYPQKDSLTLSLLFQFIILSLNTILNLHTCFYLNDIEVKNIKKIRIYYLKKYCFQDCLLFLTLSIIMHYCESNKFVVISAIILLNILVIKRIKINILFTKTNINELFQKFLEGLYYCHLFTIISISINNENIIEDGVADQCYIYLSLLHKYILQYLQIQSELQQQLIFELLLAITVQGLFIINKISLLLEVLFLFNQNIDTYTVKKNYLNLKSYLTTHNFNQKLTKKALHNYKFEMKKELFSSNAKIDTASIKYINFDIQKNIEKIVKTKYFKQAQIFHQFSEAIQEKLIESMQYQVLEPNEIIVNQNKRDDQSIYLIKNGQIKVCFQNSNQLIQLKLLQDSEMFGEVSFFSGLPRTSTIITLGRIDFLNAIRSSRSDLVYSEFNQEIACYLRDSIIFDNQYGNIGLKCICCNSTEHLIHSCTYLRYQPNKEKIISQHQFDHYQNRRKTQRYRIKSNNSRHSMFQLNLIGEEFQENNFFDGDESDSKILQDLTYQNCNQQSSNQISYPQTQQTLQGVPLLPSRERIKSIDKNSVMLANDLDDIKEQFQEIDQMIQRKDLNHPKGLFSSNQNLPLQEIIQELESEESSSKSLTHIKQESKPHQIQQINPKQNLISYPMEKCDKLSEQFIINSVTPQSQCNITNPIYNQELMKISRQRKKSYSCTPQFSSENTNNKKWDKRLNLYSEELDKNNSEIESQLQIKKVNKSFRLEDNTNQFFVFTNTNPYHSEIENTFGYFDKAQNFTNYYPYFNPNYLINQQNDIIILDSIIINSIVFPIYIRKVDIRQVMQQVKKSIQKDTDYRNNILYQ